MFWNFPDGLSDLQFGLSGKISVQAIFATACSRSSLCLTRGLSGPVNPDCPAVFRVCRPGSAQCQVRSGLVPADCPAAQERTVRRSAVCAVVCLARPVFVQSISG